MTEVVGNSPPKRKKAGGREAGTPNKSTRNAREAIASFVEGNVPRLNGWLDRIEKEEGPLAAFKCVQDLIEYHVPKLARTEHVGDGGGAVRVMLSSADELL